MDQPQGLHLPPPIAACFRAINGHDEEAFVACLDPEVAYFGSLTGTATLGVASLRGVFRAVEEVVGYDRIEPLQLYGVSVEFAVLCALRVKGRAAPAAEQIMIFRLSETGAIERFSILWDPGAFLRLREEVDLQGPEYWEAGPSPSGPGPEIKALLEAYFRTFNAGDEEGHYALLHPDLEYFGSLAGARLQGVASTRGVFRSARTRLRVARLEAGRVFGKAPEFAVLVNVHSETGGTPGEGVWVFGLTPDGRVRRLSALWNPLAYLKANPGINLS